MKIEILSQEVRTQSGTSKRTGNPYSIRKQTAFMHIEGEPYPVKFEFNLPENATAYPAGFYSLDERTFYVDRFNSLAIGGELKLRPIASSVNQKAS